MRIKIMDKKTNFPDLERLPPHNHLKHFIEWLINKPKMMIEVYVKKNFPDKNLELEILKQNLELKEYELSLLKKEIQELKKYSNLSLK
tara:strand:- start:1479 stop:1742 length:264 start_codon:yes stop_codon:yes gene_type:complete